MKYVDEVTIDRSFIKHIHTNATDLMIVDTSIRRIKELNSSVEAMAIYVSRLFMAAEPSSAMPVKKQDDLNLWISQLRGRKSICRTVVATGLPD
jgi:hypothetical protein